MEKIRSFLFVGGDERQLYAADKLKKEGYKTAASGFENYGGDVPCERESLIEAELYDAVVLPLPLTRDNVNVNAPFSGEKIGMPALSEYIGGKIKVFGGKMSPEISEFFSGNPVYDCYSRDDFQLMNAIPTAEGIAAIAVNELPVTVRGSKFLVLGFGRIGRAVGELLKNMGASVTVGARRDEALSEAGRDGFDTLDIRDGFDIPRGVRMTVNTVPARIISEKNLRQLKGTLYAEAASAPFGADLEKARETGVKAVLASGIPGKTAPESAGRIIAETIMNILKEDGR